MPKRLSSRRTKSASNLTAKSRSEDFYLSEAFSVLAYSGSQGARDGIYRRFHASLGIFNIV
jgi:hypothetical protein